jgi:hypothetical protein
MLYLASFGYQEIRISGDFFPVKLDVVELNFVSSNILKQAHVGVHY